MVFCHNVNWLSLDQLIERSPLTVNPNTPVLNVLNLMSQAGENDFNLSTTKSVPGLTLPTHDTRDCVLVVEENRLVGIFTERDVLRLTASRVDLTNLLVAEVMTHSVVTLTLSKSQNIFTALSLMSQHRICHLPIVDEEGQLLGLVTLTNLLQAVDFQNMARYIPALLQRHKEQNAKLRQVNQELQKTKELSCQNEARQILELEEANKLLQQRDRQWQDLFDNALDAIAIADDEGRYVDVNPAACELFGLSNEELLHKRVTDFADPTLDVTGVWQQFLQQGQLKGEFILHRPDGQVRQTEFAAVANFIPHRHLSILRDITNRKQAELMLQQQILREQAIADISQDIRHSLKLNEVLSRTVERVREILNADRAIVFRFRPDWQGDVIAESVGAGWTPILSTTISDPCFGDRCVEPYRQGRIATMCAIAAEDLEPCYVELLQQFQVQSNLVVPILQQENLWGLLIAHQCSAPRQWQPSEIDLLRQLATTAAIAIQQSELYEALRQSEQQLQAILDNSPAVIYLIDSQNRHLLVNRSYTQLLSTTSESAIGKSIYEVWPTEIADSFAANNQKVFQENQPIEVEETAPHADGVHTYLTIKFPLQDANGIPYAVCGISTDITEKKQLEAQFYRAQRLESLGTLAGGIAHDLNNILTPILGIAQLLPLQLSSCDPEIDNLLKILHDSAKRGSALVKQILSFARGGEEKECQLIQIKHLLWEVKNFVQQTFPKTITVEAKIPKDLWTIRGDSTQLHQVLMNLCVNARDAMSDGGTLSISAANQFLDEQYVRLNWEAKVGSYLVITVCDTGTGIPPEIVERIFDPFFTTKELGKGTGLGLSTVRGIIKAHGGFITVRSELGRGSQLQVYLPAAEIDQIEREAERNLPRGKGELILLVDDEVEIREITKKTLETYNYRVLTASDGIEAIAVYAQHQERIDAVLLDLIMPEMDGLTAMRTLHKINPNLKIIAVSGVVTEQKAAEATEIGSRAFLAKPYTTEELLLTLRSVISNSHKAILNDS